MNPYFKAITSMIAFVLVAASCGDSSSETAPTTTTTTTIPTTTTSTVPLITTSVTSSTTTTSTTSTTTIPETTITTEPYLNNFLWMGEPAECGVLIDNFGYYNSEESILAVGEYVLSYEYIDERSSREEDHRTFTFFRFDFGCGEPGEGPVIDLNLGEVGRQLMNAYRYVDCYVPFDPTAPPEARAPETQRNNPMRGTSVKGLLIPGVRYPLVIADLSESIDLDELSDSLRIFVEKIIEYDRSIMNLIREGGQWFPPEEEILLTKTLFNVFPVPPCVHSD